MRNILILVLMLAAPSVMAHSSDKFLDLLEATKKSILFIVNTPEENDELTGPQLPGLDLDPSEDINTNSVIGTGFIVKGGYIVTNWHVVEGAVKIEVFFENSRKSYIATVIGSDEDIDIAVLKTGKDFPTDIVPLEWRSKTLRQGEEVWAIGHPLGFTYSVTKGIISHLDRRINSPWQPTIQTDTAINKGNSGGPLLDMDGKVVGVNVMLVSKTRGFSGVALAIDYNVAKRAVKILLEEGKITRPLMGVLLNYDEETSKVVAWELSPGGAAELAGILRGDLYLEVDGITIVNINDVFDILAVKKPDDIITVKLLRDGVEKLVNVKLSHLSNR